MELSTGANASNAVTAVKIYILAWNDRGTAALFDTRQCTFAAAGAAMSATEQLNFFNAVEDYMDAVGAGVI